MKRTFEGFLFNRIEIIGNKKFNHIGCEGNDKNFVDFLEQFVPEIGLKRKIKFTIEANEESKKVNDYLKPKAYLKDKGI